MKKLLSYLIPYKYGVILSLIIKIIGTVMELVIPFILAYIINTVIKLESVSDILIWCSLMIISSLICIIFNIWANRISSKTSMLAIKDIRSDLFNKIENLSLSQIDNVTIQSLVTRCTQDTYNFHQMIGMFQRMGIRAPILIIGGIIFSIFLDPIITLILAILLPLILLTILLLSKRGIPLFNKLQEANDEMVNIIRENITGIKVIKAFNKEEYEKNRFDKINKNVSLKDRKAQLSLSGINPIINLLLDLGLVFVILVGAYRINLGLVESGSIIAFLTYFAIISNAIVALTRLFTITSKATASATRIVDVLNLDEDLIKTDDNLKSDAFIEFRNVSFGYKDKLILENISFKINKGESLGIIGETGSGKSTIINLLMRFYDVNEGSIFVDGKNIKSYDKEELTNYFGVVFQNDFIFRNTIDENIKLGRNIDINDIKKATNYSIIDEFIEDKEEKYNYMLSAQGANLSGGQKQRILVSRALASNPKILILDDSSSALDYKTDQLLRNNIKKLNTTSIIIAQRVSSLKDCNQIIIMENGKITGIGNHDSLLKENETYKAIKASQMGGDFDAI